MSNDPRPAIEHTYKSTDDLVAARAAQDEFITHALRPRIAPNPPIPKYPPIPPLLDCVPDVAQPQPFWLTLFDFAVRLLYVLVRVAFVVGAAWLLISWACDISGYDFVPLWWISDFWY